MATNPNEPDSMVSDALRLQVEGYVNTLVAKAVRIVDSQTPDTNNKETPNGNIQTKGSQSSDPSDRNPQEFKEIPNSTFQTQPSQTVLQTPSDRSLQDHKETPTTTISTQTSQTIIQTPSDRKLQENKDTSNSTIQTQVNQIFDKILKIVNILFRKPKSQTPDINNKESTHSNIQNQAFQLTEPVDRNPLEPKEASKSTIQTQTSQTSLQPPSDRNTQDHKEKPNNTIPTQTSQTTLHPPSDLDPQDHKETPNNTFQTQTSQTILQSAFDENTQDHKEKPNNIIPTQTSQTTIHPPSDRELSDKKETSNSTTQVNRVCDQILSEQKKTETPLKNQTQHKISLIKCQDILECTNYLPILQTAEPTVCAEIKNKPSIRKKTDTFENRCTYETELDQHHQAYENKNRLNVVKVEQRNETQLDQCPRSYKASYRSKSVQEELRSKQCNCILCHGNSQNVKIQPECPRGYMDSYRSKSNQKELRSKQPDCDRLCNPSTSNKDIQPFSCSRAYTDTFRSKTVQREITNKALRPKQLNYDSFCNVPVANNHNQRAVGFDEIVQNSNCRICYFIIAFFLCVLLFIFYQV